MRTSTAPQSNTGPCDHALGTDWYRMPVRNVADRLGTPLISGLTESEARKRLDQYGPNEVSDRGGRSVLRLLLAQFTGVLTVVLFAAAVLSLFLGDLLDATAIVAIVVLNAALGFFQEHRAEQSMAALKRLAAPVVRVRRDAQVLEIPASALVPGDVVLLETGNVVPADARLLRSSTLRVQESALTGESEEVDKDGGAILATVQALGDRRNMVYSGTVVSYGHGEAIVTATGMATELGKIAGLLQSVEQEQTPLQKRLDQLGRRLATAALVLVVVIFALGVSRGEPWREMMLVAVSLAVAAIPEALTAVVTIALSLGAQRMLRRRALIRRLPAVETLGSVQVICSDKTGTLTQNRMTVTALDMAAGRVQFAQRPERTGLCLAVTDPAPKDPRLQPNLDLLLIAGALCNDAVLRSDDSEPEVFRAIGDPTEGALVLAAACVGILQDDLHRVFPRVAELPFDSVRKRMTTVHEVPSSSAQVPSGLARLWERWTPENQPPPYLAVTKGAIDGMLAIASAGWVEGRAEPLDASLRARIMAAHDELARDGLRILCIGLRRLQGPPSPDEMATIERELILVGLVGMMDPPRPEVQEAVRLCRTAGIRPVMITGDHPLTARHIARTLGISEDDAFVTGAELDGRTDAELRGLASEVSVFARVSPAHKIRLVQAYQDQGNVVAMTGDGVNDAPALKKADIGLAMGITGTDVAKEAAQMVLLDDNFATIVAAVEEGRVVYDNVRRFIKYLLTSNASEVAVMLLGPVLGMPLPLLPLQILWMNLVTDGLPALALGVEPGEEDVMRRPPQAATASIFGRGMVPFIVVLGTAASFVSLGVGLIAFRAGVAHWQTLLFTTLIFTSLALAVGVRSEKLPFWKRPLSNPALLGALALTVALQLAAVYVPFLQRILRTTALPARDLLVAFAAGAVVLLSVEVWKWVLRRTSAAGSQI
jgi:P-type Ca2+ transporter type 2C